MTSMKNPIEEAIIMKIRKLRLERNISQMALSDILNVSDGQIGNIESSRFQHKYNLKQRYTFCTVINYPFEKVFLSDEELASKNSIALLIKKIIQYEE